MALPGREFGLVVGEPVEFRFLGSTTRREDPVGETIDDEGDAGAPVPRPVTEGHAPICRV